MTPQTLDEHGTKDKAYGLVWYVEECLKHTERLQNFAAAAERDGDNELAEFFRQAQSASHDTAERAKKLLGHRLVAA
jgi:rubrerythrin